MPVWLRNYTFNNIREYYEKRKEEEEKALKQSGNKKTKVLKPNIRPTYKTKASK